MDTKATFLIVISTLAASVLCGHNAKASVVSTIPAIRGWKGEDIRLPCNIQEEPFVVYWIKKGISDEQQQERTMAKFVDGNFKSEEERFNIDRNFSLVINDLKVADEGLYHCQVVMENLEDYDNSTYMTISSVALKHTIEQCVYGSQSHQSPCIYQTTFETPSVNITCVVSGFRPNISMQWTDGTGKTLHSVASKQTTLPDDTFERLETITVSAKHGTEQTFMCTAAGDSLFGTSTVEVTILHLPGCGWIPCWQRPHGLEQGEEGDLELRPLVESSSLTKEQVQQCQKELKAYYRMSQRKVTLDPLIFILLGQFELDEIYTNLSLIDISTMRKAPIRYSELLTNDESGNLSKRILIQGEAGVGKSTLCAKIAFDWCKGNNLQDLDLVLIFPLRIVTNVETIGDIVQRYLSDSIGATAQQINNYISSNPSKVLIVFDGFDEFNGTLSDECKSEVLRILGLQQYKSVKVLVTTRPWRTDEIKSEKSLREAYSFISIEGFNKENLSTYIKNYFRMKEKETLAEDLISFMEESCVIRTNMAPFPIYCAMLCLMWNELSEKGRKEMQQLRTFSDVFREILSFLKEHYASKLCNDVQNHNAAEHVDQADTAFKQISEIALTGLLQRNLSFPEEQFTECWNAMKICSRIGVLTMERDIFSRDRRLDGNIPTSFEVSRIRFPHKLFQEYIAGMHIAMLFSGDRKKYNTLKSNVLRRYKEFRYLLYFSSAFGHELGLDIINDLKKTNDQNLCVSVAFECHAAAAIRAVGERWEEYKLLSHTPEHTKSGIVFMVHCDQVKSLYIDLLNCGRTLSRDLAEGMCSSRVLQEVTIGDSEFHTDFYEVLSEKASTCQIRELDMRFYKDCISEPLVATNLANFLCCLPHMERATLNFRKVPRMFLTTIASNDRRRKIKDITINEKSLSELLGDI
ncbi:uncharacterized protein [Diadema setosum]|uniref:uncharacterized protein n=1 Tax=Diadema setosum TaxID=31175 RepID=UPI003B3A7E06